MPHDGSSHSKILCGRSDVTSCTAGGILVSLVTLPVTLANNTIADANDVMADLNAIVNDYNGSVSNANISGSAAIAESKITFSGTSGHNHSGGTQGRAVPSTPYIGTFTRSHSAASGSQAITGVGFTPSEIEFLAVVDGQDEWSYGFSNAVLHYCVSNANGSSSGTWVITAQCIRLVEGGGLSQEATVASLDSDGFTLTWTRTGGTAAGTIEVRFIARR